MTNSFVIWLIFFSCSRASTNKVSTISSSIIVDSGVRPISIPTYSRRRDLRRTFNSKFARPIQSSTLKCLSSSPLGVKFVSVNHQTSTCNSWWASLKRSITSCSITWSVWGYVSVEDPRKVTSFFHYYRDSIPVHVRSEDTWDCDEQICNYVQISEPSYFQCILFCRGDRWSYAVALFRS